MINEKLQYIPKGGMCANCINANTPCDGLDFENMPKISKGDRDGLVIVRCTEYVADVYVPDDESI